MSRWTKLRDALRREKQDLDAVLGELQDHANSALDRKERELDATPAERLATAQDRAKSADDEFDAIRRRIEGGKAD
ncbi:MAG TPA: hypothetical protein VE990_17010 [Acidimicrobiales bacterium]|nr:hypothetical protein [Acidimicrobiales bacterium]